MTHPARLWFLQVLICISVLYSPEEVVAQEKYTGDSRVSAAHSGACLAFKGRQVIQSSCGEERENNPRIIEFVPVGNNGAFWLKFRASGLCVDIGYEQTNNGAKIIQHRCHRKWNQRWRVRKKSEGVYQLVNPRTGKCLDVPRSSQRQGEQLILFNCRNQPNQFWNIEDVALYGIPKGDLIGYSRVMSRFRQSGRKCLDSTQWLSTGQVCSRKAAQRFGFYLTASGDYEVKTGSKKLCLDIFQGRSDDGTPIIFHKCHGKWNQRWHFEKVSNRVYTLVNPRTGKCVQYHGNSHQRVGRIRLTTCNTAIQQHWIVKSDLFDGNTEGGNTEGGNTEGGNTEGGNTEGGLTYEGPFDDRPLNELYYVQVHNTYEKVSSITHGFSDGLRSVELDVLHDPSTQNNDPQVAHEWRTRNNNNACSGADRLSDCLGDLVAWQRNNPNSGPILVFVDLKPGPNLFLDHWTREAIDELDDSISTMLGPRLFPSDELLQYVGLSGPQSAGDFRRHVALNGWPTLKDVGNRIVIFYTGGAALTVNQKHVLAFEYIVSNRSRLPHGFFCPDIESHDSYTNLDPNGAMGGMTQAESQYFVCSNMLTGKHYQQIANSASRNKQIIHLYGGYFLGNDSFAFNYVAIGHGISVIGRDGSFTETWNGTFPLVGERRREPGYFSLVPDSENGWCMDVRNGGDSDGAHVQLSYCANVRHQNFVYTAEGQLRPEHADTKCVDIEGGEAASGKLVHLWNCDGGWSEKWRLTSDGKFQTVTENENDPKYCLSVDSITQGSRFVVRPCNSESISVFDRLRGNEWIQVDF